MYRKLMALLLIILALTGCKKENKGTVVQQPLPLTDFFGTWTLYSYKEKQNNDSVTFVADTIACMPNNVLNILSNNTINSYYTAYPGTFSCTLGIDPLRYNNYLVYGMSGIASSGTINGTWGKKNNFLILKDTYNTAGTGVNNYATIKMVNNKLRLSVVDTLRFYLPEQIITTVYNKK